MLKPKPTPEPTPPPTTETQPTNPLTPTNPIPNPTPNVNPVTPGQPTPTPGPQVQNELISNHQNRENIIQEILSMGFVRVEVEQALTAAFYNKERAIDYLINGIPENVLNELSGKYFFSSDFSKK